LPTTPRRQARTGIALGSTEIGNLGISSVAPVPLPRTPPLAGPVGTDSATVRTVSSPP
jgi:hypothetical protein